MRLPNSGHTSRPSRIHDIAGDFRLVQVEARRTPAAPDDVPRVVA